MLPPPRIANYPRDLEPAPPFRIWPADLAIGVVALLDTLAANFRFVGDTIRERDSVSRDVGVGVFVVILVLFVWLQILAVLRRRRPMWVLLVLDLSSLAFSAATGFAEELRSPWEAASTGFEAVSVVYLLFRLLGTLGPATLPSQKRPTL